MVKVKKQKIRLNIAPSPDLVNYIAHNIQQRSIEYSRDRLEVMLDTNSKQTADSIRQQILDKIVEVTDEGWEDDVQPPQLTPAEERKKVSEELRKKKGKPSEQP